MKIDSTQPPQRPPHHDGVKPSKPQTAQESAATPAAGSLPAAVAHLGSTAADASQDVDHARVEEIRQAIAEGRLEVKPERIAQGLLASVRDMLDEQGRA